MTTQQPKPDPATDRESTWSEARLQSEMFTWHWNTYPAERGLLFAVDNNATDQIKGNVRKAMGRVAGVSDMIYLYAGKAFCLEIKKPGKKQSPDQKRWQLMVQGQDITYAVIEYLADFQKAMHEIHHFKAILPF